MVTLIHDFISEDPIVAHRELNQRYIEMVIEDPNYLEIWYKMYWPEAYHLRNGTHEKYEASHEQITSPPLISD